MLNGIPHFIMPDLLWVLASMGHGDTIAIVDRNFSGRRIAGHTTTGKLIRLEGIDAPTAVDGILQLMPLDDFVDAPLMHMEAVDGPGKLLEVHQKVLGVCMERSDFAISSVPVERFAYYPLAMASFALVQTSEARPYGNFLLKKGVVT